VFGEWCYRGQAARPEVHGVRWLLHKRTWVREEVLLKSSCPKGCSSLPSLDLAFDPRRDTCEANCLLACGSDTVRQRLEYAGKSRCGWPLTCGFQLKSFPFYEH